MKPVVSASGYTNVILVLNMKRFILEKDQPRFEAIRGTPQFASVLRHAWADTCWTGDVFSRANHEKRGLEPEDVMSTEEVGFATGVFRSPYLEDHTFPTYQVNKETYRFLPFLKENLQTSKIFLKAWEKWEIFIRPTSTGMFVIRLLLKYPKPIPTETIASQVIELQSSLDVKSARHWLDKLPEIYADDPETLHKKENNIRELLNWLGATDDDTAESLKYVPVQWKIAMEVANRFISEVGYQIPIDGQPAIQLVIPTPRISNPLHDSYVIYHIDELMASRSIVPRFGQKHADGEAKATKSSDHSAKTQVTVLTKDIHESPEIQQHLVNLIEGSVLLRKDAPGADKTKDRKIFPTLEREYVENILSNDLASWTDELCLLTSRTAIFYPARHLRTDELLISTLPGSTSRVMYIRYWGAIERMIEFILEIRVLARLVEGASYRLLGNFSTTLQEARTELIKGDIKLDSSRFIDLVTEATNLRRLAALCQGLGNPQSWSRAEYAVKKANFLFDKMGMQQLLQQIDRNIDSVNSAVDHLDELYLADLAEDSNNISFIMTLGLAAFSLLLTLLIIPSFWADLLSSDVSKSIPRYILSSVGFAGDLLAMLSLLMAFILGFIVSKHAKRIRDILYKFLWK